MFILSERSPFCLMCRIVAATPAAEVFHEICDAFDSSIGGKTYIGFTFFCGRLANVLWSVLLTERWNRIANLPSWRNNIEGCMYGVRCTPKFSLSSRLRNMANIWSLVAASIWSCDTNVLSRTLSRTKHVTICHQSTIEPAYTVWFPDIRFFYYKVNYQLVPIKITFCNSISGATFCVMTR